MFVGVPVGSVFHARAVDVPAAPAQRPPRRPAPQRRGAGHARAVGGGGAARRQTGRRRRVRHARPAEGAAEALPHTQQPAAPPTAGGAGPGAGKVPSPAAGVPRCRRPEAARRFGLACVQRGGNFLLCPPHEQPETRHGLVFVLLFWRQTGPRPSHRRDLRVRRVWCRGRGVRPPRFPVFTRVAVALLRRPSGTRRSCRLSGCTATCSTRFWRTAPSSANILLHTPAARWPKPWSKPPPL